MLIGLQGHEVGKEDDPIWSLPAQPLDRPISGKISKARREDLQILAFAMTSLNMVSEDTPFEILNGRDPPDRIIRIGTRDEAVELTELTITDVRRELDAARKLGWGLQDLLHKTCSRYEHLVGQTVSLSIADPSQLPRNQDSLLNDLCLALSQDKGCVGDGIDFSQGMPNPWPNDFGFYGQQGPVYVKVDRGGLENDFFVSSSCQSEIRLSEAVEVVRQRVEVKDLECNQVLLMSCGLPDQRGYVCPLDHFLFEQVRQHINRFQLSPVNLRGVFLHQWGTHNWLELYRSSSDPPAWPLRSLQG